MRQEDVKFSAEAMGIDVDRLQRERFDHPDQLHLHHKLKRQAAEYWARERFLARIGEVATDDAILDSPRVDADGHEWRTVRSLAEEFFVHPNTIYNWIRRGFLPRRRKGEFMIRVSRETLDELKARLSVKAPFGWKRTRLVGDLELTMATIHCERCGFEWSVDSVRKRRTLCQSCKARQVRTVRSTEGKCQPWQGFFAADEITPIDDDGAPVFPGVRSCGNNDCINIKHVIGYGEG